MARNLEGKWADTKNTLERLKEVFARFGLPVCIVSDDGTPITSSKFSSICLSNGIKHLTTPPGHPASNGAAENMVKSFMLGLKKIMHANPNYSKSTALNKYLLYYKITIITIIKGGNFYKEVGVEGMLDKGSVTNKVDKKTNYSW